MSEQLTLQDLKPQADDLLGEVLAGLSETPKLLPSKFFYDKRGSQLFDAICALPEYYPTRTEMAIMRDNIHAIRDRLGPRCLLIELGSGSSMKTHALLDAMEAPAGYVPIDISREHLLAAARRIDADYPSLEVLPVCADYLQRFDPPIPAEPARRRVAYFPGSTIGNFRPAAARAFLQRIAELVGPGGGLLIGIDLRKDPAVMLPAYNDAQGVTAAFNLNLLERINRELGADFKLDAFEHRALWNAEAGRIEMHLFARSNQTIRIDGRNFKLDQGESIRTECSYKHTLEGFAQLATNFRVETVWTDEREWFSVLYLVCT